MDCAAQSMDPCFAQQSMDCLLNPWNVCSIHGLSAQSMECANEGLEVRISTKPSMHGRSREAADSTKPVRTFATEAPPAAIMMLLNLIAYSILASKYVY